MPTVRPLRIVHMAGTDNGAPWMIAFLREQKAMGHDVAAILSGRNGTIAPILEREGIPFHTIEQDLFTSLSPVRAWRKIASVARLLRELRPDVLQTHLFQSVMIGRMAGWLADVPVRLSMNTGPYFLQGPPLMRNIEVELASLDTKVIASCELTRTLLVQFHVPPEHVELVYYTVDPATFDPARANGLRVRRELGLDPNRPVIGIVAYFYPPSHNELVTPAELLGRGPKGQDVLLRAVPRVLEEFPHAQFVLVGRGWGPLGAAYEKEMHELAHRLGIADSVHFPGERTDIPDVLASFDISLHCSLNENLGGSVESLLMARPMIATRVGGLVDTVLHEKTGLLVPPDDPVALSEAILRLLRDPAYAKELGENGRRFMLERFTLQRSVADLEAIYQREIARSPRGYRLRTRIARHLWFPFRVGPLAMRSRLALAKGSPVRSLLRDLVRGVAGLLKPILKRAPRKPAEPRRPRIAQIAAASDHSPWFVDICTEMARRGCAVLAIIDSSDGDLARRLDDAGIPSFRVPMILAPGQDHSRLLFYLTRLPFSAFRLARILRRERIEIAQSHIFVANILTRLARILTPFRHIATIAGPRHLEAPLTKSVDRFTWWLDDLTVGGCRYTAELYRAFGLRESRLAFVYYGARAEVFDPARVDGGAFRRELGIAADVPLVGLVAQFYPPIRGPQVPEATQGVGLKGHEHFLGAARLLAARFPDARFVLAGNGSNARGEEYRQSLIDATRADETLRDRVLFTGHRADVPQILAALDVAVQCSLTENLGGTIEALLMERPMVATAVGGMPEAVRHEETGLLVPPADPAALAAAIARLLSDRDEAKRFAKAGRALMLRGFTLGHTGEDIAALYARVEPEIGTLAVEGAAP